MTSNINFKLFNINNLLFQENLPSFPKDQEIRKVAKRRLSADDEMIAPNKRARLDSYRDRHLQKDFCRKPFILEGNLYILDQQFSLDKPIMGKNHAIYAFQTEKSFLDIPLSDVILRTPRPDLEKKYRNQQQLDLQGYARLVQNKVPLPQVYIQHFEEPDNPKSGGFWLIERIPYTVSTAEWGHKTLPFEQLSETNQNLLAFVKYWLSQMHACQEDLIPDFFPRNVMRREDGSFCIVDFGTLPSKNSHLIQDYIEKWSDGNPQIANYLNF